MNVPALHALRYVALYVRDSDIFALDNSSLIFSPPLQQNRPDQDFSIYGRYTEFCTVVDTSIVPIRAAQAIKQQVQITVTYYTFSRQDTDDDDNNDDDDNAKREG